MTIARWVAGGVRTLLCFDPTRGIDIGTKNQIYQLLRDLADAGAAILLYTSELKEVQLVCDRAIIIFGGKVVDEIDAADADEPTLLRAAYHLRSDAAMPEEIVAEAAAAGAFDEDARPDALPAEADAATHGSDPGRSTVSRVGERPMTAATGTAVPRNDVAGAFASWWRRNTWTIGLLIFLAILLAFTKFIQPTYGASGVQGLAISVLPLALATVGQAIVVISGGIDLSIGSMMALTSVVAASLMKGQSEEFGIAVVVGVILLGIVLGRDQRQPRRPDSRAGHRRHAGDVLRLGGLCAPRAEDARRRRVDLAQGPAQGVLRQRMGPAGGRRPDRHRRGHLDPDPALEGGSPALRDRERPTGGVPERRLGRPDEDPRLRAARASSPRSAACPSRPARGSGRRSRDRTRC